MLLWCPGCCPESVRVGALRPSAALLLAFGTAVLAGCSAGGATESASIYATQSVVPTSHSMIEIEGDGLEGQRPPLLRKAAEPDDPSQPFSPNYGGPATAMPAAQPASMPAPIPPPIPDDLSPA